MPVRNMPAGVCGRKPFVLLRAYEVQACKAAQVGGNLFASACGSSLQNSRRLWLIHFHTRLTHGEARDATNPQTKIIIPSRSTYIKPLSPSPASDKTLSPRGISY